MMMGIGLVGTILVIVLVVVVIAALVGWRPQGYQDPGRRSDSVSESAKEILEKRYAKGDINKEEFDRISKDL